MPLATAVVGANVFAYTSIFMLEVMLKDKLVSILWGL